MERKTVREAATASGILQIFGQRIWIFYEGNVGKHQGILENDIYGNHVLSLIASSICLVQIRGSLRVILRPLIPAAPLVGGVSVFFLNRPVSYQKEFNTFKSGTTLQAGIPVTLSLR